MSFNLRNIREISNEPLSKFVSHLAYRIAKLTNDQQTQELENKEDIYSAGQDVDSVLRLHSLNSTKTFDFETAFYPPFEPDYLYNTLWVQGYNMGNKLRDISGFSNNCSMNGDPILIDGSPFDYGIHTGGTKSTALRFNRVSGSGIDHSDNDINPTMYPEYVSFADNSRIQIDGSTNISYFFRVRPLSTDTHEGKLRTIYCKTDTEGANTNGEVTDAVRFCIDNVNKRLVIMLKRNGVFFCKQTTSNAFVENNIYDGFITYDGTSTIKLYLAKITSGGVADPSPTDMTLSDSGYSEEWGSNLPDLSARLMKRGAGANDGAFHGDLYDFKVYRNKEINIDEASNHWTNKWTISDIPFGQVMIADYYAPFNEVEETESEFSFTPTSFTNTSFTTWVETDSYTDTSYTDTSYTTP